MVLGISLRNLKSIVVGSRTRRMIAGLAGLLAFAAAVATLWGPAKAWLWPREFHVYVLHPDSSGSPGIWEDFDFGLEEFLASKDGHLDGNAVPISGQHELLFRRKKWEKDQELPQIMDEILSDSRTLAVVAATTSQQSEAILARLRKEEDPPLLLLATATKNGLVRQIVSEGKPVAVPGVFRMVPKNEFQAARLAGSILAPALAPQCLRRPSETTSVVILREERDNAAFSSDLAVELRRALEEAQKVEILVDAVVDSMLTVPRELVEMEPDFLVYIGSQTAAASLYRQFERLRPRIDSNLCLPRLLLTDAGLLGDRFRYYRGLVEASFAALPFSGESIHGKTAASFASLGSDSGLLIHQAAVQVLQRVGRGRLSRGALIRSMKRLRVKGQAHQYLFEQGENSTADFHLWEVMNGVWRHADTCSSDWDDRNYRASSRRAWQPEPAGLRPETGRLRIGAKPFPEQRVLAAIAVQTLTEAGIPAQLGEESLNGIRDLLLLNRIDAYWEYTGTALHRAHGQKGLRGAAALRKLRLLDGSRLTWMNPLAFNNTYLLLARTEWAQQESIETISQLAEHLAEGGEAKLCANGEWLHLNDGLRGLQEHYGFVWPADQHRPVSLEVVYHQPEEVCEVRVGFTTDAELLEANFRPLVDDRIFFPEYQPAIVFREDIYRELIRDYKDEMMAWEKRLACLEEELDRETMRQLNRSAGPRQRSPIEVADHFLEMACPNPVIASARETS